MTSPRHLTLPTAKPAHFERNFIQQMVCELRFPTRFELEAIRPPLDFAHVLRKEYPNYETGNGLNLNAGGVTQANVHMFKSKKQRWTVALRASTITIETSHYDSFDEFEERLALVLKAAEKVIDSDFFTRVGLRYINSVPFNVEEIQEWVNPALVGVLGSGVYGDVEEHWQRVVGTLPEGGYLFQHGLGINARTGIREYALDFDFFGEDVPYSDVIDAARKLHEHEFAMFSWSLGNKAKSLLGPSTLQDRRPSNE